MFKLSRAIILMSVMGGTGVSALAGPFDATNIANAKSSRDCANVLQARSDRVLFGNFRVEHVSLYFNAALEAFGARTGRVMGDPGNAALVLYQMGHDFEFAVRGPAGIEWHPSSVIGRAMVENSANGTPLEKSDILDLKPGFELTVRWLAILHEAKAALVPEYAEQLPNGAVSNGVIYRREGYFGLDVFALFSRSQMEALLWASLSSVATNVQPSLSRLNLLHVEEILRAGGFGVRESYLIAIRLQQQRYALNYFISRLEEYQIEAAEAQALRNLFWLSSKSVAEPPAPLPR